MGPLQLYEAQVNGYATRMRLNAADAERLGGVPVEAPETRAFPEDRVEPPAKKRAARNKSRSASNKGG